MEIKESPMPSSKFYHGEKLDIKEIFDKKETAETCSSYFVNIGPNLAASIPESKVSFQNYIHYNGPCLSTINLTDIKLENAFASLKTNKSSEDDDISALLSKECSMKYLLF